MSYSPQDRTIVGGPSYYGTTAGNNLPAQRISTWAYTPSPFDTPSRVSVHRTQPPASVYSPPTVAVTSSPPAVIGGYIVQKPTDDRSPIVAYDTQASLTGRLTPCLCECVGTLLLTFTVAGAPSGNLRVTAIAAAYIALVYAMGFLSGAQLNPAISFAAFLSNKMSFITFLKYTLSQFVGAVLGSLLFWAVGTSVFLVGPVSPFTLADAALVEFLYSTMLCFVGLNVMYCSRNSTNQFFAIALGFVLVAGGYAASGISGGVFNPVLVVGLYRTWKVPLVYVAMEMLGGVIAALLFRVCRLEDFMASTYLAVELICEFLGSFWLVLTFGLTRLVVKGDATCHWSAGAALVSMTYALQNVSGAHFNPVVTLAVVLSRRDICSPRKGFCFFLAQVVGALPAAGIIHAVWGWGTHSASSSLEAHVMISKFPWYVIVIVEMLFTLLLAYVVLAVTTSSLCSRATSKAWPNFYFALAIGFAFAGTGIAASTISGGYLNPAVVLGFLVAFPSINNLLWFLAYTGSEIVGGILAACLFRLTHAAEYVQSVPEFDIRQQVEVL